MTDTNKDAMGAIDAEYQNRIDTLKSPKVRSIVVVFVVAAGLWLLIGFVPWWSEHGPPWSLSLGLSSGQSGVFGDSFGFVNSLFSGLALAGVVVAIHLQRQELAEQRKQLVMNEWSQARASEEQKASQREALKQSKLSFNFMLLNALQGIQDFASIDIGSTEGELHPRGFFLLEMVNDVRQTIIAKSLADSVDDEYGYFIKEELRRWLDLILVMDECNRIAATVRGLLFTDTGSVQKQAKDFNDIDPVRYKTFFKHFRDNEASLSGALSRTNDDAEQFRSFLEYSENQSGVEADYNRFHQLKNLLQQAEKASTRARENLSRMSKKFRI